MDAAYAWFRTRERRRPDVRVPLPPDAAVRRINDKEAADMAKAAAKAADGFKKVVAKDAALPKEQRQAVEGRAETLVGACKEVRSRLDDHKPATAEARQMFDAFQQVSDASASASPSTQSAFGQVRASMETLRQAFGLVPPPNRVALRYSGVHT